MSGQLKLTLACGDYEIVRALKDGTVRPDGIELTVLTAMGSRERHWRMARRLEFDICELNVGAHFMAHDQGVPLAGLPIYLHRRFRHGFLFVNAKAGIREPRDLAGKTIGGTNFQPAANIWMRGILEEDYGLPHRQVTWLTDRAEDIEFERPKDLRIAAAPAGASLETMLAEGEIPALLSPSVPQLLVKGDKRIARLFPDYKDIEIEYFRRTGIFPIMHTTVIKQAIVDAHPWVATNLVKAFDQAKALAYRCTWPIATGRAELAWVHAHGLGGTGRDPRPRSLGIRHGRRQSPQPRDHPALHPPAGHDPPAPHGGRVVRPLRSRRRRRRGCGALTICAAARQAVNTPPMKITDLARVPADPPLAEELADDIVVEMANLTTAQTGVTGTIFISPAMGGHGPRVKYFVRPGRTQPSFSVTIADQPNVAANSLPARIVQQMSPSVVAWVSRNKDALLDFWYHGDTWTHPEVSAFITKLQRV